MLGERCNRTKVTR